LKTNAAPVNEPNAGETAVDGGLEIGLYRGADVARRKGVQIENVFNR
jgi:hypothetical protein